MTKWEEHATPFELAEYQALGQVSDEAQRKRAAIRSRCLTRAWRKKK